MSTEIVQVRGVLSDDVATLRSRAAARDMSLSSYLRELIHADAARPSMAEFLDRLSTHEPVDVDTEEILGFIHDDQR